MTATTKRRKPALADVVVAVSVFSEARGTLTYNELVARLKSLGASYSSIVHRRVAYLVATEEAANRRTQRIRKALKFDVPVVSVSFLDACDAAREPVPHEPYLLDVPDEPRPRDDRSTPASLASPRVLDLGCCCSCHDSGAASCSFCADAHPDAESSEPPVLSKKRRT